MGAHSIHGVRMLMDGMGLENLGTAQSVNTFDVFIPRLPGNEDVKHLPRLLQPREGSISPGTQEWGR